jgi:hypothetical protein
MELNKYDLVEFFVSQFDYMRCDNCPIRKECAENDHTNHLCLNEDEMRETLIKKYNL